MQIRITLSVKRGGALSMSMRERTNAEGQLRIFQGSNAFLE